MTRFLRPKFAQADGYYGARDAWNYILQNAWNYILQNFLKPINSPESMQDCFEFSLERLILKIFVGGLSFLVILSNGQLTKNTTQSILRSLKSRRLSGTGSTVSRSQESFTTRFKTTNI